MIIRYLRADALRVDAKKEAVTVVLTGKRNDESVIGSSKEHARSNGFTLPKISRYAKMN